MSTFYYYTQVQAWNAPGACARFHNRLYTAGHLPYGTYQRWLLASAPLTTAASHRHSFVQMLGSNIGILGNCGTTNPRGDNH